MPIETERPGVFRGRKWNTTSWYVVDPASSHGVDGATRAWLEHNAPTNSPRWRRVLGTLSGWLLFLGGTCLLILWVSVTNSVGFAVISTVVFVVLGVVSLGIGSAIASGATVVPSATDGVMALADSVRVWANDAINLEDLWELNLRYSRVIELHEASMYILGPNDEDAPPNSEWTASEVVRPALEAELAVQVDALESIATRLGYPMPEAAKDLV